MEPTCRFMLQACTLELYLVKNSDELIFNHCGEFPQSPEGPISQIHSPNLNVGAPGIFSDFLGSVHMVKRELGV